MLSKSALLVGLVVLSLWQQLYTCSPVNQEAPVTSKDIEKSSNHGTAATQLTTTQMSNSTDPSPQIGDGIKGILDAGARSLEPWLKSIAEMTKVFPKGNQASDPVGSFMNILQPKTTTAPTTTPETTQAPAQQLSFGPEQLLEAPVKVVSALTNSLNLTQGGPEASPLKELARIGEQSTKVFTKFSGIRLTAPPEDEITNYEFAPSDEWDGHRRPKYFSKECNFRIACEVGRMMKPMLYPAVQQFKKNKIVQDLQSRYSRAMAYGTLHDNCEKYYCVFFRLFGGPQKFVSATAEIISNVAAPEPEGEDGNQN